MVDSKILAAPRVRTRSGELEGQRLDDGVAVFRGIPYAEPPVGALRWRPPVARAAWSGVRDATTFGDRAPQTRGSYGQDCLSLNVWTLETAATSGAPVFLWIHGGRFIWGSGDEPRFDGTRLAAQGVVVVTINYRLGIFGFLAHPELSAEADGRGSGNYGLLDQIAALQWVKENIAAFGGDPSRVTIAGQSAGGASVLDLVYSPLAAGLFSGAIVESAAVAPRDPGHGHLAASYRERTRAEEEGAEALTQFGVLSLAALRKLPTASLLVGNDANQDDQTPSPPRYRPVLDGHVLPRRYGDLLHSGLHNDVPMLVSVNRDDNGASPSKTVDLDDYLASTRSHYGTLADEYLALYPASNDAEASAMTNKAISDRSRSSVWFWAQNWREAAQSPVFTYYWDHVPPGEEGEKRGAFHESEIPYVFDSLHATAGPWRESDYVVAATLSAAVAAFVSTGVPAITGQPDWNAIGDEPVTMRIGSQTNEIPVASRAILDFWRRYFDGCKEW